MTTLLALLATASAISVDVPAYIVENEATTISFTDAGARRTVWVAVGTMGLGAGPCPAALGGDCLDVVSPSTFRLTSDAAGEADLTVTLPPSGVGYEYCLQAVSISRGVASISEPVCTVGAVSGTEASYGGHDYLFTGLTGSIASAGAWCGDRGMHVVTVEGADERDWLDSQLVALGDTTEVWLGIFDEQTEGLWQDVWGEPLSYTDWLSGEPNNFDEEDCAAQLPSTSAFGVGWNDVPCSNTDLQVVCEADGEQALYGNHIYTFSSVGRTWEDAINHCALRSGYLVVPDDADEDAWIMAWYAAEGANGWLGLTDALSEGAWQTSLDDSASWLNWRAGEPNNSGDEDCANVWHDLSDGWNDASCSLSFSFICESW